VKHIYYPIYLAWIAVVVAINLAGRRRLSARALRISNIAWGLATCVFMILASEPLDWFYEFRIGYWHAARLVLADPMAMYGPTQFAFVNLPLLALLFVPFAWLAEYQAGALFVGLAVVISVIAWRQLIRLAKLDGKARWLLAGLFVLNGPLFYCLRQGNATILVLPLLVAALASLLEGRSYRCGLLLAVAGLIKPPLLLLPAYYTFRREWRITAGSAGVGLCAGLASLGLFGVEVHRAWYACCVQPFAGRALASYTSQSVSSCLARMFCPGDCGEIWWPIPVDGRFRALQYALVGALALATLLVCLRRAGQETAAAKRLDYCLVLCLALVSGPVCWTHYFLILLLPAALLLGSEVGARPSLRRLNALAVAFLAMSLPVRGWSVNRLGLSVLVSHYLAGALLLMAILGVLRYRLGPAVASEQGKVVEGAGITGPAGGRAA
jgi:hypothetical protein